jgi:hypothetical protein
VSITCSEHLKGWTLAVSEATAGGVPRCGDGATAKHLQGFACRENDTGRVRPDQGSGLG